MVVSVVVIVLVGGGKVLRHIGSALWWTEIQPAEQPLRASKQMFERELFGSQHEDPELL